MIVHGDYECVELIDEAIAACGRSTVVEAAVSLIVVTVVAAFDVELGKSVTAASNLAYAGALIFIHLVSVITAFCVCDDGIAASRCGAEVCACVSINGVGIITLFLP